MSFFGLFGSFGLCFFDFPIRQPNERDKLNKPNKRNEPVWSLPSAPEIPIAPSVPRIPTAAACELKDADPADEPLPLNSVLFS
jgi:hypothetical protein